jgi:hypothetical protein
MCMCIHISVFLLWERGMVYMIVCVKVKQIYFFAQLFMYGQEFTLLKLVESGWMVPMQEQQQTVSSNQLSMKW